jgi:hypothetical protein
MQPVSRRAASVRVGDQSFVVGRALIYSFRRGLFSKNFYESYGQFEAGGRSRLECGVRQATTPTGNPLMNLLIIAAAVFWIIGQS